ncbi:TetR/AcrR family transcriptional regulator [Nocardia sp. NPDC051570]|uniref:TetR/AcrR family transcriptional regulator n=1 Tax=Nocardia sp. NPDC051570 TaxID=3364324 RepID=UPI0037972919
MTPSRGLREQAKARVRREVIHTALRLFERQGFEQTTVQEIADEAHVARRTVHRHFPSKTAIVFTHEEDLGAHLISALQQRPPTESAIAALRGALHDMLTGYSPVSLSPDQVDTLRRVRRLLTTNPELRQANFIGAKSRAGELAAHFAQRCGRPEEDLYVQLTAETCFAALSVGFDHWINSDDHSTTALQRITDSVLTELADGLDIPAHT